MNRIQHPTSGCPVFLGHLHMALSPCPLSSSGVAGALPRASSDCLQHYSAEIEASCDVFSRDLKIHRYSLGFALLCGCCPQNGNLLMWIKDPQGFRAWMQGCVNNAVSGSESCNENPAFMVTLQPPLAKQLSIEFTSLCHLSMGEQSLSDPETLPILIGRFSFLQLRQKHATGNYSTRAAVMCDALSSELVINQATLGFCLLCGLHPEGQGLLAWIKVPQDFMVWLQSHVNAAFNSICDANLPAVTRVTLHTPLAVELGIEFTSTCSIRLEDIVPADSEHAKPGAVAYLSFADMVYHIKGDSGGSESEATHSSDVGLKTRSAVRRRR